MAVTEPQQVEQENFELLSTLFLHSTLNSLNPKPLIPPKIFTLEERIREPHHGRGTCPPLPGQQSSEASKPRILNPKPSQDSNMDVPKTTHTHVIIYRMLLMTTTACGTDVDAADDAVDDDAAGFVVVVAF